MGRIPKKVECMIGQANLRSPGKRSAPGAEFSAGIDPRVRPAALPGLLDFVPSSCSSCPAFRSLALVQFRSASICGICGLLFYRWTQ